MQNTILQGAGGISQNGVPKKNENMIIRPVIGGGIG